MKNYFEPTDRKFWTQNETYLQISNFENVNTKIKMMQIEFVIVLPFRNAQLKQSEILLKQRYQLNTKQKTNK